jgi:hypothetical protein
MQEPAPAIDGQARLVLLSASCEESFAPARAVRADRRSSWIPSFASNHLRPRCAPAHESEFRFEIISETTKTYTGCRDEIRQTARGLAVGLHGVASQSTSASRPSYIRKAIAAGLLEIAPVGAKLIGVHVTSLSRMKTPRPETYFG